MRDGNVHLLVRARRVGRLGAREDEAVVAVQELGHVVAEDGLDAVRQLLLLAHDPARIESV